MTPLVSNSSLCSASAAMEVKGMPDQQESPVKLAHHLYLLEPKIGLQKIGNLCKKELRASADLT